MKYLQLVTLLLVVSLGLTLPPARPTRAAPPASFTSNPEQDSGWVRAQVVGGGCNGNGSCTGTTTPGAPTLYEYVPDREPVDQDGNLGANMAQHGGHPTAYARQICSINGQQMGWSAGMWHHGATWTLTSSGVWQGPSSPHWAFEHDDRCRLTPTPTMTPPPPTATPQPGVLTVNVIACGQPFGTRITRTDTGESRDGASSASFTVPSGQTLPIRATGYGDFADTSGSGQAGQTITIEMIRRPEAGPCSAPTPTPGGPPATPTTPPSGPPCTPTTNVRYLVLNQSAPAPAPLDTPTRVPAGALTVQLVTNGARGADTGQVVVRLVDVTGGGSIELAKVTFIRPYANGRFTSTVFRPNSAGAGAWQLQTSAAGAGFVWNNGWVHATSPALQSGHTYRIDVFHSEAASCGSWNVSNYVVVDAGPLTVQLRRATLGGVDTGPIAGRQVTIFNAATGQAQTLTSDGQGTASVTVLPPAQPADPQRNYVSIRPDLPGGEFVWQITGSCAELPGVSRDLEAGPNGAAGALRFVRSGGCTAIFTYIPLPTITARVTAQDAGQSLPGPFAGGTLSLVAADGAVLSQVTPGTALTALPVTSVAVRPHVREGRWSLSYAPPATTPPWLQLLPVAGSGGDQVPGDLAVSFAPGDTLGNLFRLERGAAPPADPPLLAGSVVLIRQDGSVVGGPYGTVELRVPGDRPRPLAVDGQGRFLFQLSSTTTTTVALQFTKNLLDARYDRAEPGTVNGQPSGQAGVDRQSIHQIELPPGASGQGYRFVLRELPPPPPPPVPQGTLTLWAHSHLDPAQGVHQTTGQTLGILHAEVFDITPHVALEPLPTPPAGYRYDQQVVAWAFDGTGTQKARDPDALGRRGCRPGAAPTGTADTSLLSGCVYRYVDAPSAGDMAQQVRVFWKVGTVPPEPDTVYAYTLPRFQAVGVQVSVLVETSVTDLTTGQRWTQWQVLPGTFAVQLVTPRTSK